MIFRDLLRSERPLCDLGGARTLDPLIKSQLLYQLSYGVICRILSYRRCDCLKCGAKLDVFFYMANFLQRFLA